MRCKESWELISSYEIVNHYEQLIGFTDIGLDSPGLNITVGISSRKLTLDDFLSNYREIEDDIERDISPEEFSARWKDSLNGKSEGGRIFRIRFGFDEICLCVEDPSNYGCDYDYVLLQVPEDGTVRFQVESPIPGLAAPSITKVTCSREDIYITEYHEDGSCRCIHIYNRTPKHFLTPSTRRIGDEDLYEAEIRDYCW